MSQENTAAPAGLASLAGPLPEGVLEAAQLVQGFDDALRIGFGRLGAEQVRALDALARAFTGTPLAARATEAVAAVRRSEFSDAHFATFAALRSALQGAQHDALAAQVARALGREASLAAPAVDPDAPATPSAHEVLLESARQWLLELALAGCGQWSPEAVLPFGQTLEKLQEEPALTRIAALLTGLHDEVLATLPLADDQANLPLRRWCDLWARGYVLATKHPAALVAEAVRGTFVPFGVDVRQHDTFISYVVHGLLLRDGAPPFAARATVSSYKVDVLYGAEAWGLFAQKAKNLCAALSEGAALAVDGVKLLASGELLWNDAAAKSKGKGSADLANALPQHLAPGQPLARAALAGADRHPVQLAEPVWLASTRTEALDGGLVLHADHGFALPLATERFGSERDFTATDLIGAVGCAALLRFDAGRWRAQPLCLVTKNGKKVEAQVHGALGAEAGLAGAGKKASALPILKERASKLLRVKS